MPTTVAGNVRNMGEGRAQALQALERVSDRLGEILRDVPGDGTHQNENGELVNEEGLPIIDITEPVDDLDTPSLSAATEEDDIIEDNYPEPISKLSPEALAISRKHRDKILELLEEEEIREERRTREEQQAELQRKREAARSEMQKRMVTQSAELEKRRQAKEIEKKMAKALVSGLGSPNPATENKVEPKPLEKKQKSVSFAALPPPSQAVSSQPKDYPEAITRGDVVPGQLSEKQRLASRSRSQPMKMEVIERTPLLKDLPSNPTPPLPEPLKPADPTGDSDDESDADEQSDSTVAFESGGEDVVLSAHRHRDLALEYHKRREALTSSVDVILPEDIEITSATSNNWDNKDVPLEATLAHPPPKSPVSRFKAQFANSTSQPTDLSQGIPGTPLEPHLPNSSSTFGVSVLPPSALAEGVKMGKLVDGRLVAGYEDEEEAEREAREEEEIRKLLLRSTEEYSGIAAQVIGPAGSYWAKSKAGGADSASSTTQPPPKPKPKMSRFKVNRTQWPQSGGSEATTSAPTTSNHSVSTSHGLVDSPSFKNLPNVDSPSPVFSSVVDSPSFLPPSSAITSFPPPTGSPAAGSRSSLPRSPPVRLEREPVTMADDVVERSSIQDLSVTKGTEIKPQRVSRFKAERPGAM